LTSSKKVGDSGPTVSATESAHAAQTRHRQFGRHRNLIGLVHGDDLLAYGSYRKRKMSLTSIAKLRSRDGSVFQSGGVVDRLVEPGTGDSGTTGLGTTAMPKTSR
jgi:hypothetical protein